jgi:hypothetical protein
VPKTQETRRKGDLALVPNLHFFSINLKLKIMLYKFDKRRMDYVLAKDYFVKIVVGIIASWLVVFGLTSYNQSTKLNSIKYITEETRLLILNNENKFSEEKLKEAILALNIKFPHIVLAQAKLESGHFKSKIFKENNNFFGMKVARCRPTTNKGEQNGHAYFDTWKDCLVDYAFYQAAYLHDIKTEDQYLAYLKANYAEDPNYFTKLLNLIKR